MHAAITLAPCLQRANQVGKLFAAVWTELGEQLVGFEYLTAHFVYVGINRFNILQLGVDIWHVFADINNLVEAHAVEGAQYAGVLAKQLHVDVVFFAAVQRQFGNQAEGGAVDALGFEHIDNHMFNICAAKDGVHVMIKRPAQIDPHVAAKFDQVVAVFIRDQYFAFAQLHTPR